MAITMKTASYKIIRDHDRCIECLVCVRQCSNGVHRWDEDYMCLVSDEAECVNCHRCVVFCPTQALNVVASPLDFKTNANWRKPDIEQIYLQAETGGRFL